MNALNTSNCRKNKGVCFRKLLFFILGHNSRNSVKASAPPQGGLFPWQQLMDIWWLALLCDMLSISHCSYPIQHVRQQHSSTTAFQCSNERSNHPHSQHYTATLNCLITNWNTVLACWSISNVPIYSVVVVGNHRRFLMAIFHPFIYLVL